MKNDSRNSQKKKRNVTDWHTNNSKSNWFSQSQKNDWRQNLRRRAQKKRN